VLGDQGDDVLQGRGVTGPQETAEHAFAVAQHAARLPPVVIFFRVVIPEASAVTLVSRPVYPPAPAASRTGNDTTLTGEEKLRAAVHAGEAATP
jgi:hypothetical protein